MKMCYGDLRWLHTEDSICRNLIERSHGKIKVYIDTFQNSAARLGVRREAGETEAREARWGT